MLLNYAVPGWIFFQTFFFMSCGISPSLILDSCAKFYTDFHMAKEATLPFMLILNNIFPDLLLDQ